MASRPSPDRRRSARGSSRPSTSRGSQLPMMIGGAVVLVVVLVFVLNRGGSTPANAGTTPAASPPPAAAAPAPAPIQLGSAKAGKPPKVAAPALTSATLQELDALLVRVKALRNEAVTARSVSGTGTGDADIATAKSKMGEAKTLLEEWVQKIDAPLKWQEQAQLENWAQPAEYVALEQIYATYQKLDNEVRKGGG